MEHFYSVFTLIRLSSVIAQHCVVTPYSTLYYTGYKLLYSQHKPLGHLNSVRHYFGDAVSYSVEFSSLHLLLLDSQVIRF